MGQCLAADERHVHELRVEAAARIALMNAAQDLYAEMMMMACGSTLEIDFTAAVDIDGVAFDGAGRDDFRLRLSIAR